MKSFGITDRGKVRRDNQDSYIIERLEDKDAVIAVLCDGMGGEKAGNIASDVAAKTYVSAMLEQLGAPKFKSADIPHAMREACHEANHMVYGYSCFDSDYTGMGTTLVSAVAYDGRMFVLNVGDSRAYKLTTKGIEQITRDHSLVQELLDRGEITPEQALNHPRRNVITRALGVNENVPSDVFTPRLNRGETLLLCSDGLTNMVQDKEIHRLYLDNRDPLSLGRALMTLALDRGARDNVTIVALTK